jgi:hypothetical protein
MSADTGRSLRRHALGSDWSAGYTRIAKALNEGTRARDTSPDASQLEPSRHPARANRPLARGSLIARAAPSLSFPLPVISSLD